MNTFYGIGVGPGEPENMTLKALRTIEKCDVIVLPNKNKEECYAYKIVRQVYAEIDSKTLLFLDFPMCKDSEELETAHNKIYMEISKYLEDGDVAFLTIGDPTIYSTYSYIEHQARLDGYEVSMISGVTSFCAAAARLGISLGLGSEKIHIIPGSGEEFVWYGDTCVYMKSGRKLSELINSLNELSKTQRICVYAVSNCGMDNEKVYYSIDELNSDENIPYITVVIVKTVD